MHRIAKIRISQLNEQVICGLCFGYLIDAVTIVECLHSFCRSCLVLYLDESKTCPLCCQLIHKTKPLVNVRSDKTLQNLVYKLVPGLFKSEMKRRRDFYSEHPEAVPDASSPNAREERGDIYADPWSTHNNEADVVSVSIQYSALFPITHPGVPEPNDKRYLLCPSYITVAVLKKFIRCKFDLPSDFHIELYYSDECLDDSYSVMDIASLYSWRRTEPLRLFYFTFNSSPSSILSLQRKSDLSLVPSSNSISLSDEKVVERQQQLKKVERMTEDSWLLKPSKKFRIRDFDKTVTGFTLSSKLLSSMSEIGNRDETFKDKRLCSTISLADVTSDSKGLNAKKQQSLLCSADSDSGNNNSVDPDKDNSSVVSSVDNSSVENSSVENRSVVIGTGVQGILAHRTAPDEVLQPLRFLRLSPKLKSHATLFKPDGVLNRRQPDVHSSGVTSSHAQTLDMSTSLKVPDATARCASSSLHQSTSSASVSSVRPPSSTESRSIWSVLPSPRIRIQEAKPSATVGCAVPSEMESPGSLSSSFHAKHYRPSSQSRGSIFIYEDPHPSTYANKSTNLLTSTIHSTSTTVSKSTVVSTPTAKVGIVICRGRAMPLQDKHLHMPPIVPTPLPPPAPRFPPVLPPSSSSDPRKPTSVKRLLQLQAESENLRATKKHKLSSDDQDGQPPPSTASLLAASHRRTLGALAHVPTVRQKVAPRVFRDRNSLAFSSPPSLKPSATVGPLSPLLSPIQAQTICRSLKLRGQVAIERTSQMVTSAAVLMGQTLLQQHQATD